MASARPDFQTSRGRAQMMSAILHGMAGSRHMPGPAMITASGYIVPLRCWIIMKVSKVYSLSCAQRKASFLKASWFS